MADWIVWLVMAGVLVILELFTGTFYLLMVALGFAAGGIAAFSGAGNAVQLLAAALVGVGATYGLRRLRAGHAQPVDAAQDPNVNLDIGQSVSVDQWLAPESPQPSARVLYRGAMWDVELATGAEPRPGLFVIRETRGSRLVVANSEAR